MITSIIVPIVIGIFGIGVKEAIDSYKEKKKVVSVRVEGPFALIQIHKLFDKANISYKFEYQSISGQNKEPIPERYQKPVKPGVPPPVTGTTVKFSIDVDDLQIYRIIIKTLVICLSEIFQFASRLNKQLMTSWFYLLNTRLLLPMNLAKLKMILLSGLDHGLFTHY